MHGESTILALVNITCGARNATKACGNSPRLCPQSARCANVTLRELEENRNLLNETIYKRCRHVVTENDRVLKAASALREGEIHILGELMADSHKSLRDDYAVSCPELDLMVDIKRRNSQAYTARA